MSGVEKKTSTRVESFNPISAYQSLFGKIVQFEGRSRRSEYWFAGLASLIIVMVYSLIMALFMMLGKIGDEVDFEIMKFLVQLCTIIFCVYLVVVAVAFLALAVRRLHDVGKSGWFLLLNLIPLVGWIIVFIFSVTDSKPGENQYGPNPKGL